MRIAAISIAPLFPNLVIGGSQKILADVAVGLKNNGHDIQIWCTGTDAHEGDFEIHGVVVHPDLKLRGSFPATHQVSPIDLAHTASVLRKASDWANRVYLHADAVYLRHALGDTPIIRSIHDYVYEETLISTMSLQADATVVPSEYLKRCIEATVALSGRTSIEPVIAIPNGVHVPESLPEPSLPYGVSTREESDLVLLFPHRPEPTKGVREAIQTAVKMQKLERDRNVRLLMPSYPANWNLDEAADSSQEVKRLVAELGASDIVELHGWLNPADMAGYYAAGDVTLCVGSFVESFGLVPLESVANGTPAVCAMVGALRQFHDVDGISLVPYGRNELNAEAVLAVISKSDSANLIESGRKKTSENYSIEAMVSRFESVVTRTLAGERNIEVSSKNRLTLAPWCDVQGDSIYDDYTATSSKYPELTRAIISGGGYVSSDPLLLSAALDAEVRYAREHGVLIPDYEFN